ncbi:murein hydrolase activator EnvC family protein [Inediibacterium massiliense]|uniref:murein hydrolase activator EnvC family protein n=1 Tax=Inediibacterium massiliense TaxID=1658111 RepID=UPI0006B67602|nr:peptidoglycan DD-metalloendopeptidase family protein [Inediibacterium massiliense]
MDKGFKKSLLLIGVILSLLISPTFAQNVTSDQKKLDNVNKEINNAQKKLRENKQKEISLSTQIKQLDEKIYHTEQELAQIDQEVNITKKKINVTQNELQKAENNIENKNDTLNARLRVMYKNGDMGYAEVLLNSESIIDLLSNLDMVKKIFSQDMDLLAYMKGQRDDIATKKKILETHRSKMVAMMSTMQSKQKELQVSRGEAHRIRGQIQNDSKELEKQVDELNDYAEKIVAEIRKKQSTGKYVGGKLAWPAPGYTRITSPYGYRIHPILKRKKMHTGIDIGIPAGKSVVAAGDGVVMSAGTLGAYGKAVTIDHGGGIVTLYAHNSSLLVSEGQKITRGQVIAKAGSTGRATGPHLHFEVRKNGKYTDPIPWVK